MFFSIRKKLFWFLTIATLFPFTISIWITYIYTTESVKEQFIHENLNIISKGRVDLSNYFQDITSILPPLYQNRSFMNVMESGAESYIEKNQEEISRTLINIYFTRKEIEQVHLYIRNGNDSYTVYSNKLSSRGKYEHVEDHPFYKELLNEQTPILIEGTHPIYSYNHLSFIPNSFVKDVVSFHQSIYSIPHSRLLGFLSIDIELSEIQAISERLFQPGVEDFFLINDEGMLIFSSEKQKNGEKLTEDWYQKIQSKKDTNGSLLMNRGDFKGVYVYEKFSAPYEKWMIVKSIPYDVLYENARRIAFMNIFIGAVMIIVVLIATFFVSIKITSPIKLLIENIKRIEKGELKVHFKTLGNDEFGLLGQHFKSMIDKINDLILREYLLEIKNKSTQLKVLQSQVNPHFLYNSLQSIGTLALKHKAPKVYSLLISLSSLMRYSINMDEDFVSLEKEMKHVQTYLMLQKERFGERLEYDFNIEHSILNSQIPKMILQPIVENYFKHAFEGNSKTGRMEIVARQINDTHKRIIISDNGSGISEKRLREIIQSLSRIKQTESVGLKNIYDRLQIYYGSEASMDVYRGELGGFTVDLCIPISREEERLDESIDR
jgi:two-component system sensor histidine kinase YesM